MATATAVCNLENYLVLPDHTVDDRIAAARKILGRDLVILGHHYQRDEVIRFADFRGDSYKLSQEAAAASGKYIVFCGVHFMAESADILSRPGQIVIPSRPQKLDVPWPIWPISLKSRIAGSNWCEQVSPLNWAMASTPVTYINFYSRDKSLLRRAWRE